MVRVPQHRSSLSRRPVNRLRQFEPVDLASFFDAAPGLLGLEEGPAP